MGNAMSDDTYEAVAHSMHEYPCGLVAGDQLRLRRRLEVVDHRGRPTGQVHSAGEIWTVLVGASSEPTIVWLEQPDGEPHTWDDEVIFESFERIDR